ncbi:3-hydroxyisobutyrate dehydrogenase [Arthrobacter sp. zg-Y820]|uniref:3-hydroxyisobutyrate dehydrogenase n=1 Tax=unclassified Arthrobacter TaxID=235627 RepID=UPI001E43C387|nr:MULTISPECIES: 3-hydroxyisobutyrate dehydrogenase [unclassified Arthrobacter]MCC9196530.1 3-hydroxyisobutyrate dehydrogenase [Arthrobacter sp. zg-Y820]MDK1279392.1 3-hydroxyisobutyrate dehydrogenase [Arthrobacter sp. zg.Y820]MDK1358989.1 3-hydroxyisobutyrate dehydrogenase [Arthrobacter sp. zg-Y1219]WIB08225.1 3-hydroxyisobutyrate dehydrogenase [Arthrobacter sp. zg-Y820]
MTGEHETRIGFIGLGNMGGPMAANLVTAGYPVTGYDPVPAAAERAVANGIRMAATADQAAAGADVVITMLPTGQHVLNALSGDGDSLGLLAAAPADALFLECSTISVDDAHTAHALMLEMGHRGLDAPVSGGVVGAEAGTLTFMVGGAAADFAAALPLLNVMGGRVVHCGDPGAGQAAKICNNMILGVSMIAVSEAFVLGEELGLTHEALFDVASAASGQCWALTTNCPVPGPVPASPANRDYQPGFAAALMAKDLGLAADALDSTGVRAELGRRAGEIYRDLAASGGGGQDFSAVINVIRAASSGAESNTEVNQHTPAAGQSPAEQSGAV